MSDLIKKLTLCLLLVSNTMADLWPSLKEAGLEGPACGEHRTYNETRRQARARPAEFPYLAEITMKLPNQQEQVVCSGALIHRQYILTSLRCANDRAEYKVRLGSVKRGRGQELKVRQLLVKPLDDLEHSCGESGQHGLAALQLENPVNFSLEKSGAQINKVCYDLELKLPAYRKESQLHATCWVEEDQCAKATSFKAPVPGCPNELICATSDDYKNPSQLQEGAALVDYDSRGRLTLLGIHCKELGHWEAPDNSSTDKRLTANFIALHSTEVMQWLWSKILN